MLCEQPFGKAPITPVLSPQIFTSLSSSDSSMTHSTAISRATDSAQLMSLPSDFHPAFNLHVAQCSPTTTPMPQLIKASTHILGSTLHLISKDHDPPGADRIDLHHEAHSMTEQGTWCLMYSFWNCDTKV